MSFLNITFDTQSSPGSTLGYVRFKLTIDGVESTLNLFLYQYASTYGYFTYYPWNGDQNTTDYNQASNYADAFNRDYSNVGGTGNLSASVMANIVTISSVKGTFSDFVYSGDYMTISGSITNTTQQVPKTFSFTSTSIGDCDSITYTAQAATGGTAPYRLNLLGNDILAGWDGNTDENFELDRGIAYSGYLYDSTGTQIRSVSIRPPRKLLPGDFKVDNTYNSGFADVRVRVVTEVSGTTPLEYALVDSDSNQSPWQVSTLFAGQLSGLYTLKVRDKYECEIEKAFEIYDFTDPTNELEEIRYFKISDFNSLSFAEKRTFGFLERPNYENTLSHQEEVGIPVQSVFKFPSTSTIKTQFKSSYPVHVCTLLKSDGTKESLPLELTQENLGVVERVDCKVFPILQDFGSGTTNTGTGIFFEGGNSYVPNTSTLANDPNSPYNGGLPSWAKVGSYVSLATFGTHQITATDQYDEQRGVLYFKVDIDIESEVADIVQVKYNRHPYNIFRCDFKMSKVSDHAKVVIEAGWDFDQIERRFDSELIKVLDSPKDHLKITWTSDVNFDDMVFSDGIDCEMWIKGRIRPFPIGASETAESDDRVRSLRQRHRMGQRLDIPLMSAKQWHKLGLASGIADDGEFRIENMLLVITNPLEAEDIGDTNFYDISAEYAYAGENLAIKEDEIILNPSTGVIGSGQTGKEPKNDPVLRLLRLDSGKFLQTNSGKYISLDV